MLQQLPHAQEDHRMLSCIFLLLPPDHSSGLLLVTMKNVSTLGRCSQSWEIDATLNLFKNCRSMLNKGDNHSSLK